MPPYNTKIKPIVSDTNVTSYSDPFTGESFILPTSAHNTQAKINYDKQKALRKRTQDLIALDPQTAESMLLNIGGAWEEGRLRDEFRDIRKTGVEAERKKAAKKAEEKELNNLERQARAMYKHDPRLESFMENEAGLRSLMLKAYKSNQPTLKEYNRLAQPFLEKYIKTVRIGATDAIKLWDKWETLDNKLASEIKGLGDRKEVRDLYFETGEGSWSKTDETLYLRQKAKVEKQVQISDQLMEELNRGHGGLIPKGSEHDYDRGKQFKNLKKLQPVDPETKKKQSSFFQKIMNFVQGKGSTQEDYKITKDSRGFSPSPQDTSQSKEQQLDKGKQVEQIIQGRGTPALTDEVIQQATGGGSLEHPNQKWERERGQGEVGTYHALPPEKPLVIEQGAKYKFEETPNLKAKSKWDTSQDTIPFERGTSPQSRINLNLDGTSAQEVTTEPPVVATQEEYVPNYMQSSPSTSVFNLSDSGNETLNHVVVEKETGANIGDVDKVVKLIEAKEGKGVAQKVLDHLSEFTNLVVKQVKSRDYQRSIIGLDRFRPDEDTPDPNEGTTTPSEGGTGVFTGLNMMASSGYESVAPPVRERFGLAVDKIKKYWNMFKDAQSRDTSSSQRDPYSGSSEEMMNQAVKKRAKNKASDIAKWIQESGANVPGFPMVKHITAQELQESSGGKDTDHKSITIDGYKATGNQAIFPTTARDMPYYKDRGITDLAKIAKELEDPRVNTMVAAQYASWLHGELKKHPLVGKWATSNHLKKRKDFVDLVTGSHNYGIGNMKKLLDSMQDDDDIDDIMRYLENARSPRDKQLYTHILGYRKHRRRK